MSVGLVSGILVMNLVVLRAHGNVTLTTLVSFVLSNGAVPAAGLVQGSDGAFYGTTQGSSGFGTVFKITSSGVFSNLLTFTGVSGSYPGANPAAGLIWGADGNLYGTTQNGGVSNNGTIFKLAANGVFTSLVSFTGTNGACLGANPVAGLVRGTNGALYGTTQYGGTNDLINNYGDGTVFVVTTNGVFASLVSFSGTNGASPGANPAAGLVWSTNGFFYGTTESGGTNDLVNNGDGTIFRMSPDGGFASLISFNAASGAAPEAGLVQGTDGNLYGTTSGGSLNLGTVFKMTSSGTLTTLLAFNKTNGANPQAGLLQGLDGNFYGTTRVGGANNYGTIFQLTPAGAFATLVSFGGTNGSLPTAGLVQGTDGNFYGTTASGTTSPQGTAFRFPPPPVLLKWWQTNQVVNFVWSAATGQVYQIQFNTNFNPAGWSNLGGPVNATNSMAASSDSVGPGPPRYYRIGLLP